MLSMMSWLCLARTSRSAWSGLPLQFSAVRVMPALSNVARYS